MKPKKIILWIVLISLIFTNIKPCLAAGFSGIGSLQNNYGGNNDDPEEEPDGSIWSGNWSRPKDYGGKRYVSKYRSKFATGSNLTIDIYDQKGESLIPSVIQFSPDKFFKAGTWVGVNVTETRIATWELSEIVYAEVKKQYKCTYEKTTTTETCQPMPTTKMECENKGGNWDIKRNLCILKPRECEITSTRTTEEITKEYDYFATNQGCPEKSGYILTQEGPFEIYTPIDSPPSNIVSITTEEITEELKNKAKGSVNNSSGTVKYALNDAFPLEYSMIYGIGQGIKNPVNNQKNGKYEQQFSFNPPNVCMNTITSKVSYKEGSCSEDEVKIENKVAKDGKTYWYYFIPLNAKSTSQFDIEVIRNGTENYSPNTCVDFMKKFAVGGEKYGDKYENYITPADVTKTFTGDYNNYIDHPENSEDWKIMTEGDDESNHGCQISMKVIIPIKQRFYNEIETTQKFKGFNFYYKPIPNNLSSSNDIANKVFPNGMTENSLWKNWYDKTKNNESVYPNLKNNNITYVAKVARNVNTIREYNKNTSYMSWNNMLANGHSSFIENNLDNIFERKDTSNFYKLGCGPINKNATNSDGTTNYLYQGWCD